MDRTIQHIANRIKKASSICIFTGAGISKESGIETFRGKDGLWNDYSLRELSHIDTFIKSPKLVWQWYNKRRYKIKNAKPNRAHTALFELEQIFRERFTLITQNIDSLHRKAGNKNIYELHGNIFETVCLRCGNISYNEKVYRDTELVPKCDICKEGSLKPNVVMFGESLDKNVFEEAMKKAAACEIFLAIGTSGVVQPAASIPKIAHDNKAFVVEINTTYSGISIYANEVILNRASVIMDKILNLL